MKVRYIGESDPIVLLYDKIYNVLSVERKWFRIVDETEEDYLYPPEFFELVEGPILKDLYENEQT